MDRRTLLGTIGTGVAASVAGCAESEADAVNVERPDELEDASGIDFQEDVSVSWIVDRFIEDDTAENPVVDTDVRFTAMVLTNLQSEEERLQTVNRLQWANFEVGGDHIMGPLFKPVSWALEPVKEMTEDFYEKFKVMKVVGVTEDDQEFFDKYGMVPFVWTFSEDDDHYYDSGTVAEFEGTVRFADPDEDHFAPGMGKDRFYVEVDASRPLDSRRTLTEDTPVGAETEFTGLQFVDDRTLTSYLTEVDYDFRHERPRPAGGSLVTHRGPLREKDFDVEYLVRDNYARMEATSQEIVVGDTVPLEQDETSDTETEGTGGTGGTLTNVAMVVDVSGSMSERDTRSGQSRLGVAKDSGKALVNFVETGNRLATVAFSTTATLVTPLQEVTDTNRGRLADDVDSLTSGGDTSIGAGLRVALEELQDARGQKSIVLLSDGKENTAPYVDEILPELKNFGVTVYTIGMGSEADRDLLERIARETGGDSEFAPDPENIRTFYQQFSISAQDRSTLAETEEDLEEGESVSTTATVDGTCEDAQFSLSYPGSTISLQVERPDGEVLREGPEVTNRVGETSEVWTVEDPPTGEWTVTATAEQLERPERASIKVSSDSEVDADLFVSDDLYEQTGMMRVEVKVTRGRERYTGGDVRLRAESRTLETEIRLRDDGGGPDPVPDDGIYTGYFHPPESGEYLFSLEVAGGEVSDLRREFQRELSVDETVEDPVRPYRERSAGGPLSDPGSLVAPAGLVAGGLAVLWGMLRMLSESE